MSDARHTPEFPEGADQPPSGMSRREWLTLLGASAALAGAACTQPPNEKIVPYTVRPPEVTPGIAQYFATAMVLDGYARPVLVEAHEGRPTKVEGNPEHPASLGATGVFEQASVLELYDPARSRGIRRKTYPATWRRLVETFRERARAPEGVWFLMEPTSSPLIQALVQRARAALPGARFAFHAPGTRGNEWQANRAAVGRAVDVIHRFDRANVVVSLDSDFLASGPGAVRYARDFAERRRGADELGGGNRLYVAEPTPTPTGSIADHRLRLRAGEVVDLAAAILADVYARLGLDVPRELAGRPRVREEWVTAIAKDLVEHRGRGIVIAGPRQPPAVHAIVRLLEAVLGHSAHGGTVEYIASPIVEAGEASHELTPLVDELRRGAVKTLVVLEGNPSYTAPVDLDLPRLIRGVPESLYLGTHENETAADCSWFVAANHWLESWGDARAYDGTITMIQPLIAPMLDGRTVAELLATLAAPAGEEPRTAHRLLREAWRARSAAADFETAWERTVQAGFVAGSRTGATAAPDHATLAPRLLPLVGGAVAATAPYELCFALSPAVHDGRFANISWLQELADPATKLTWDNAALVSPRDAKALGVVTGDFVTLESRGRALRAPAYVLPGHADGSITLHLGYGRRGAAEMLAHGIGVDAYALRTSEASAFVAGVSLRRGEGHRELALTQNHWSMEDRPHALTATRARFAADPSIAAKHRGPLPSLFKLWDQTGEQWGMVVDLTVCTGCSSCVVACQAENNTPVVGRPGVLKSREMHWLRIDRYLTGPLEDPSVVNQPMMCQHCETAPCEYVCPVNATVHSPDGLNEMVYNRCVGTRFCSNNCPYKVRRFNFFDYVTRDSRQLAMNPDVTVRDRGVMEKCTYCVQRIRGAEIQARNEGRKIEQRDLMTACQQACPTGAIVFGNINDPSWKVSRWRRNPRAYEVLHDQGTRPRTQYLVKIVDPNPDLEPAVEP